MSLTFKRSSIYTRKSIGEICIPGKGRPPGGDWDTGYVRVNNNLIIFMNIGVAGRTGHDFDNSYDAKTGTITWFGKPNTHSKQPLMKAVLNGELTPHCFARWDASNPEFVYLGRGTVLDHEDDVQTKHGSAIKVNLICHDVKDIISYATSTETPALQVKDEAEVPELIVPSSSFVLEKHLEDYLYRNWEQTTFGKDYDIYENGKGRQFQTNTGPLDLLAQRKDKQEFLVLELKRDLASDVVVGQTLNYMGYIKKHLATHNEDVRGCIIANEADQRLRNALSATDKIDFYEYKLNFEMNKLSVP